MNKLMKMVCTACALAVAPAGALLANPPEDLVGVEILDGGRKSDGTYSAALRLTLKDGWKTYWRSPGDAGIPPRFTWRGSRNLDDVEITWPTPEVFLTSGFRTIGYLDQVVLPFTVSPGSDNRPVRLKGRMELGICKDVCVPTDVRFDHELNPDASRHPAIVAALASRPYSPAEAGVKSVKCNLAPSADGIRIEAQIAMPSAGGREVAVIEPGHPDVWAAETSSERHGNVLVAHSVMNHVSGSSFALDRSKVRITVLGNHHAVDIIGCTAG